MSMLRELRMLQRGSHSKPNIPNGGVMGLLVLWVVWGNILAVKATYGVIAAPGTATDNAGSIPNVFPSIRCIVRIRHIFGRAPLPYISCHVKAAVG